MRKIEVMRNLGLAILCCLFVNACASNARFQKSNSTAEIESIKEKESAARYYDFSDVLVPGELKIDLKSSFVYQTVGLSAGVLVFSGNVEITSLITFFTNNMQKDNWQLISTIKSARTLLLFKKENRWCVVNIAEKELFSTDIEIWAAPTLSGVESGLLK